MRNLNYLFYHKVKQHIILKIYHLSIRIVLG
jgi:hypothetical protein